MLTTNHHHLHYHKNTHITSLCQPAKGWLSLRPSSLKKSTLPTSLRQPSSRLGFQWLLLKTNSIFQINLPLVYLLLQAHHTASPLI
jgi:hypothetical protein